ncbi:hypothetical protein [Sulfobacillus thermosulfidooxidans]|uniref:hypothetical protein n=1 Tax=Sulfobacillus thermosulfidooxidans TaxID=28034 RepID=UPI00037B7079|nr:hypothetical protein [Sulfobacillus thermosulfidooxidans]
MGLADDGNGYGYRQDLRGRGSNPAERMGRKRPGTKLRSAQERIIHAKLAYALTSKFEQVSYSGMKAVYLVDTFGKARLTRLASFPKMRA